MTVKELCTTLGLTAFSLPCPDRPVRGGYSGDLLSWVMGKAPADGAWLTIMSCVNVCAVAVLTDVSCVILTEGVTPDADLLELAQTQGVNLLGTESSTFEAGAILKAFL
jgi:hypothetical protein